MQIKSCFWDTMKFSPPGFGKAPKALNAVNMRVATNIFAFAMVNSKMFFISYINKAIVASPFVGMNNRINGNFAANNGLERFSSYIRNYFRINFAISLK